MSMMLGRANHLTEEDRAHIAHLAREGYEDVEIAQMWRMGGRHSSISFYWYDVLASVVAIAKHVTPTEEEASAYAEWRQHNGG